MLFTLCNFLVFLSVLWIKYSMFSQWAALIPFSPIFYHFDLTLGSKCCHHLAGVTSSFLGRSGLQAGEGWE